MKTYKINKHYFDIAIDKAGLNRTKLAKIVGVTPDWIYQLCGKGSCAGCSPSLRYNIESVFILRGVDTRGHDIFYTVETSNVF